MHVYIYDSYLTQKKYESITAKIETRITDLGLSGKIVRLSCMNSVFNIIEDELKKNAKTIIVVGNINILHQAINAFAVFSKNKPSLQKTPLGFIPVGKQDNEIANILGVPSEEDACNVLSARRIETIDLGLANEEYFLTEAKISTEKTSVEIDKNYSIEILEKGEISITNIAMDLSSDSQIISKSNDNSLEFFIKQKKKSSFSKILNKGVNESVFSFRKIVITNPSKDVVVDNTKNIKTPVSIKIAKEKINIIVGKNRLFV